MTIYALQLVIQYEFDHPTGAGRQLFRILPSAGTGAQRLLAAEVSVAPAPLDRAEFTDFFGTRVIEMAMLPGLNELTLTMNARVERPDTPLSPDLSPPLAGLAAQIFACRRLDGTSPRHFRTPSRRIPSMPEVEEFARKCVPAGATVRQAVEALGRALHGAMIFDATATDVDTAPGQAFAQRRGVCQDFAQIMIGGLRALGIPAAYVAGYLRTLPPPGKPRLAGADAMHAWVRAWTGTAQGWVDYDPTNACFARADHIDVGFGRDYADVAPVVGMLRFEGKQTSRHSVDIAPEGDE